VITSKSSMNNWLADSLSIGGIILVKNFNRQALSCDRFQATSNQIKRLEMRRAIIQSSFFQVVICCCICVTHFLD